MSQGQLSACSYYSSATGVCRCSFAVRAKELLTRSAWPGLAWPGLADERRKIASRLERSCLDMAVVVLLPQVVFAGFPSNRPARLAR